MKNRIFLLITIILLLSCKGELKQEKVIIEEKVKHSKKNEKENAKTDFKKIDCEIESLKSFYSFVKSSRPIYSQDIFMFLADRNPLCKTNSEYGRLENEIIFMLIKVETEEFVLFLGNQPKEIINYILSIIENPVKEDFQLIKLRQKVLDLKADNLEIKEFSMKKNVVRSLDLAIKREIITENERDAMWENNVLQWLFGDNEELKKDLVNKIIT